jgi:hypothetical protein
MSARAAGTAEQYRIAFEYFNGRAPSIEECKDALRAIDILDQTGLDPFLLTFIIDVRHLEQRQKLPAEVSAAINVGLAQIRDAIPTNSDLAGRLEAVQTFRATMERSERTIQIVLDFLRHRLVPLAVIAGALLVTVLTTGLIAAFRWGWDTRTGLQPRQQVCSMLANVYGLAERERHLQTARDVASAYHLRCQ